MYTEERRDDREPHRSNVMEATLSPYFKEIAARPLLKPAEERSLARELIRLEEDIWARLLGRPPLVGLVADLARQTQAEVPPLLEALLHRLEVARTGTSHGAWRRYRARRARVAHLLRALDGDREALDGALALVARLAAGLERLPRGAIRRGLLYFNLDLHRRNAGALDVRNRFVEANLRLVLALVRRYHSPWIPLEDLLQEGNLGLIRAVGRFDPDRGYRFSTYAAWWIRHAIMHALADKAALVRLPVYAHNVNLGLGAASGYLFTLLGREPTVEELATNAARDPTAPLRAGGRGPSAPRESWAKTTASPGSASASRKTSPSAT